MINISGGRVKSAVSNDASGLSHSPCDDCTNPVCKLTKCTLKLVARSRSNVYIVDAASKPVANRIIACLLSVSITGTYIEIWSLANFSGSLAIQGVDKP